MKKVLCLLFVFYCDLSYGQDSTQKLTAAKVYQDVKDGFQNLVEKLQGPAKHTYEIYVRQHFISGISYSIISTALLIVMLIFMTKSFNKGKWDGCGEAENAWAIGQIVFSILSAICVVLFCGIFWGDSFSKIVNPEYFAIQDIVNALK